MTMTTLPECLAPGCTVPVQQSPTGRKRKFCCDKCRHTAWLLALREDAKRARAYDEAKA